MAKSSVAAIDWITVLIFLLLVAFGWANIYSASYEGEAFSITDLSQVYVKQGYWILLSIVLIVITQAIEVKFYERFAGLIYVISLVSLLGLFIFGKNINGATSWYAFGPIGLQPSEFAKACTALALAKFLSDMQTNIKFLGHQVRAFLIIAIPAIIIVPQPDPGSALVYAAFFFPLYREGLAAIYLIVGASAAALFILTLLFKPLWVVLAIAAIMLFILIKNRKKKPKYSRFLLVLVVITGFCFSVNYIFNNVFEQRHRDRFNIVLGKEVDSKGIGYNTNQSQIAIGSGSWTGKGWKEGTQTKGGFVPEQHTDYIFSTVGEEWGFLGATTVVILFVLLLLRLLHLAERQKSQFSRVYGYSVIGILFIHFAINIGMVTGLIPTIGIPLPFFSYGGSGLWGFTLLLFIFIKLDSNRVNEW
ncbi:rod shape-determining protein RodA [Aquimarina sp. AD10]|uniref:Rod shape-determining protein RodA n=1 Tax=Aquimarina aggregata TaxID=1642818 RepID=A0A162YVR9_9FLAO|nr:MULTISPECIES: rod shape-determining protein RodA [Aquimarina]AXT61293.1 rod shape-determining protein RodA [Aquimarina sp. AD10]KZS39389.1 rod shape-determining protein RodA [Aquimarina aggregata]RKN01512.1 rod shape-determining protein RodA [Aquimarina sp. AD10]